MKLRKATGPDGIQAKSNQALQDQSKTFLRQGKVSNIRKQAGVVIIKMGEDKNPTKLKS